MWMAEGFLVSTDASPETVGHEYFKILFQNSFFQDGRRNKWGDIKSCRMHDLVHDLAISVSRSECRLVKMTTEPDPESIQQSNKCRRLGLQVLDDNVAAAIPLETYTASKKLRTFVFSGFSYGENVWAKQIFSLSSLRVLILSHSGILELPESICKLKHLRYLDLSYTGIKTFPLSFSKLYNLQTLMLKGCYLKELRKDMRKLIGLQYLELSVFTVGTDKGSGIEVLEDLNFLGGKLTIQNLERVTDAMQANMKGKKAIMHLQLLWDSHSRNDPDRMIKDAEVITDLQPHQNLRKLGIFNFGGSKFPAWMTSTSTHLPNLVCITLENCGNCEHLPAFGGLRFLKYLFMKGFGGIKQIGNEFYRSNEEASGNEEASFPSLVELHLSFFSNLEKWLPDKQQSSASSFSCLEILEIRHSQNLSTTPTKFPSLIKSYFSIELQTDPKLKSLPRKLLWGVLSTLLVSGCSSFVGFLPDNEEEQQHCQQDLSNDYLSKIEIYNCPSLEILPADFRGLNSLTYLAIEGCSSLRSLPDGIQHLPALQTLIIGGFSEDLESFPFPAATGSDSEQYFVSLRELKICGWPTLRSVLPDQLQLLTSLECFTIRGFPCLLSLPEWLGKLSSLKTLSMENCKRLMYLPSEERMLRLTSLEILNIRSCPLLDERSCSPNEEWHKIAHLQQVNRSSPSLLDHITRYGDMNVELLARRRSGVFSNQNKEKCWVDSWGGKCFMLFPRSFNITWEHETSYWRWLSVTEPSASNEDAEIEVPELLSVCWLTVQGKLDMSKLSPGVNYEVVFVVMFRENSSGWDTPVNLCLELSDGQKQDQKVNFETMPRSQWIEIHVGDFETPQQPAGDQEKEIKFWLFEQEGGSWKSGLVIEGAIVRPKK